MTEHADLTIRPIQPSDFDIVLAWWGIPEVRYYTTTSQQPTYQELVDGMSRGGRVDYIIWLDGRRVGRTCLIDHGSFEEISVYVCELRLGNSGVGSKAVEMTMRMAKKSLRCRIRDDNELSKRVFRKAGFIYVCADNDNPGFSWYALGGSEHEGNC